MWPFSLFKKKEDFSKLKPQRVERPGIKMRLKAKPKTYKGKVAITYKGKPMRVFDITEKGMSRDMVAADINKNLGLKLISLVQDKNKAKL